MNMKKVIKVVLGLIFIFSAVMKIIGIDNFELYIYSYLFIKTNQYAMKKLLLLFAIAVTILMTGCTKDDEQQTPTGNDVRYYVRYEVSASASSLYTFSMYVNVNTEKGSQSFRTSSKLFSETFGPVSKGFSTKVSASGNATFLTSIYVCRGEEPFVLKATGTSSAEYTIDF